MSSSNTVRKPLVSSVALALLLLTALALAVRLPYWQTIPASFDEVGQTAYAWRIAQGEHFPLVANDAYAGPFYVYLLAGLIALGANDPMIGRVVVMVAGILTVPLCYAWVTRLSGKPTAGLIAALIIAFNPDAILVNSHLGGITFLLPFAVALYLWLVLEAIANPRWWWTAAAAFAAGLILQVNLIGAPVALIGFLWWVAKTRTARGRRTSFSLLLFLTLTIAVYSPVLVHNLIAGAPTLTDLQARSYLWETDPTPAKTLNNLLRLSTQTVRQTAGVLSGSEGPAALVGAPLLFLILMVGGLAYTTTQASPLPLLLLLPYWAFLPVVSSHYGFGSVGRFTTHLTLIWAAVIAIALAAAWERAMVRGPRRLRHGGLLAAVILFAVYPLFNLWGHYQAVNAANTGGGPLLELSRHAARHNQGERVYLSTIEELSSLRGVPYVPHATFLLNDVHHEFLSPGEIIGRLFEYPGPAYLLLSHRDLAVVQTVADVRPVQIAANEQAQARGVGLYHYSAGVPLKKPDFVVDARDPDLPPGPQALLAGGLRLIGCRLPDRPLERGAQLTFNCFWTRSGEIEPGTYMTFAHLIDGAGALVGQDDHLLGQERYPLGAWQPEDVIREKYAVSLPADSLPQHLDVYIGVYRWPSLERLDVPERPDDVIPLGSVSLGDAPDDG